MKRRDFLLGTAGILTVTGLGLSVSGCGATSSAQVTKSGDQRRGGLDSGADSALTRLYTTVPGTRELVQKANGALIFPSVIAAGLGVGGQYGEGPLRVAGKTADYYSMASVSVGLQIGAQSKAVFFLFMTPDALNQFRRSEGWSAGVDASVAVAKVGANGTLDLNTVTGPVVAFVLTNAGLMANLTLEGTKITRLKS
ncbi:MAG: BPSL1445 family SYLF domain-containing lipoprotein [Noviherbaspirillum sp.]